MKILEALEGFYPYVDGVVKVLDNYTRELNKHDDVECKVLVSNTNEKEFDYGTLPYEIIKCDGFLPSGYKDMRIPSPNLTKQLRRKIKSEKFDIYHIHSPLIFARYLQSIARRQKRPTVITFHTKYKEDFERTVKFKPIQKLLMSYLLGSFKRADAVWAVNSASAKVLQSYGYKGEIKLMPNGTDMSYPINAAEKRAEIRALHNINEGEKVFLYVGRIYLYKNLYFICDSLRLLKERGLKFKMIFVGEGDDLAKLREYVTKVGLDEEVVFTGFIGESDRIAKYYVASDLFLFPSTFDSMPVSLIEAAVCKLPPVLIEGCAAAEGTTDNVNCAQTKERAEDYAEKIFELCADEEKIKYLGENAARDLVNTWEQITVDVLSEYKKIIEKYNANRVKKT